MGISKIKTCEVKQKEVIKMPIRESDFELFVSIFKSAGADEELAEECARRKVRKSYFGFNHYWSRGNVG